MPTLIIDNIPAVLFDEIQRCAAARTRTPAALALETLQSAFRGGGTPLAEPPLPSAPFLTQDIPAPFDIPRPPGEPVTTVEIANYVPLPHDIPDGE